MTKESLDALSILQDERVKGRYPVPADLVERVYRIEQQVQFDEFRRDVSQKLREAINATLDAEALKGSADGNAL